MSIQKLRNKYRITVSTSSHELKSWEQSEPVVTLFKFLKEHEQYGCRLMQREGKISLHFEPGLDPKDTERWAFAMTVLDLLEPAKPDLKYLWQHDLLALPRCGSF